MNSSRRIDNNSNEGTPKPVSKIDPNQQKGIYKNIVNLSIGSSHFILNEEETHESDSSKHEILICVRSPGTIFKSFIEIRRYEDLSRKRKIKSDFSANCIYRDGDDLHCL